MPFDHTYEALTRWLRSLNSSRSPNTQVVGQQIEDNLRAVILAADVRNLTAPKHWVQAGCRRSVGAGGAGTVTRVELICLSAGGLWVERMFVTGIQGGAMSIADAPVFVGNQDGFFTTTPGLQVEPIASLVATGAVVEAFPSVDEPVVQAQTIETATVHPIYLPFGKVLRWRAQSQQSTFTLNSLWWREIPAVSS